MINDHGAYSILHINRQVKSSLNLFRVYFVKFIHFQRVKIAVNVSNVVFIVDVVTVEIEIFIFSLFLFLSLWLFVSFVS